MFGRLPYAPRPYSATTSIAMIVSDQRVGERRPIPPGTPHCITRSG